MTPSDFGGRYAHGHFQDGDRHLVVSGGIGFSGAPLRIAAPPEITLITLSGN
jgi:predicted MPP superfamily phosphohydrolase